MQCRAGEPEKAWFRSNRIYHMGDGWYFSTREVPTVGPLDSQNRATREMEVFVDILRKEGLLAAQYQLKLRTQLKCSTVS
ncbi:DUF6316 family protein [Porticoccaceae bacterium LTM1]|nr:DUF6316 family protein [Porticoccaceae bacterium LTM1]